MRSALILTALLVMNIEIHAEDAAVATARAPQSQPPSRGPVRSFGYARIGYGGVFAEELRGAPAFGFGYRGELDAMALDVSFLNFTLQSNAYSAVSEVFAGSIVKLQVLRFLNPQADRSAYVGGGMSWGAQTVGRDGSPASYMNSWHGSGLQGEVTAGYELPRTSQVRLFIQGDLSLPIFYARSETVTYPAGPRGAIATDVRRRYIPSAAVSVGIGWQRNHP